MHYEHDQLIGFTIHIENTTTAYLMFLAINSQIKSKGFGTKIIKTFKDITKGKNVYFCVEQLDEKAINLSQRIKRINFYLKNGFSLLPTVINLKGVNYSLMSLSNDLALEEVTKLIKEKVVLPK